MPSILEILGVATGILGVYLTILRTPLCWIVASVNVIIYGYIFFEAKLYADMALQFVFLVCSVYGWFLWTHSSNSFKADDSPLYVQRSTISELMIGMIITIPIAIMVGMGLSHYTDADVPYIDAVLASVSIWGQILQTKKRIEHWYVWMFVDASYICVYAMKDLYLSSMLYFIFLIMAIQGARVWNSTLRFAAKNLTQ